MMDSREESLSQQIYFQLRSNIIDGRLSPGERLRERELAADLSVSRVPVREALLRLAGDGFVSMSPRRGASVVRLSMIDVAELFDARLPLEVQATRLAAERAHEGADVTAIRESVRRADVALASGDLDRIAEANAAFHAEVLELAGNRLIISLMRPIAGRDRWIFRLMPGRDPAETCMEHRDLLKAIVAGEVEYAAALAHAHVEKGRHQAMVEMRAILPQE